VLVPQVRPAQKCSNSHWGIVHPPGETMQYVCNLTRSTRLSVTSHSRPLINAKYKFQVTNYLQTIITSWLTINIANFPSRTNEHHYNYINVVQMKSRSALEWVKVYDSIHQELSVKCFKPNLQTLDNKASTALKNFFTINNIAYQLVQPHCHRRNAAERAIRTFMEHFVAGLSSVDPSFPMHLWDRLLPKAEIT
jgi:hypothetical protein